MCELVGITDEEIEEERKYWDKQEEAMEAETDEGYPEDDNQQML